MFQNYKANGTLIGAVETTTAGLYVIIVYHGGSNQYVVARYQPGEPQWIEGSYIENLTQALDEFARKTIIYCS